MHRLLPLALALLLAGCVDWHRRELTAGVWDRIFTNGVPTTGLDRDTVYEDSVLDTSGAVTRERDGQTLHGQWSEDGAALTLTFGTDATTWTASQPRCPDGLAGCLVLKRAGQTDWFHPAAY